MYHLYERKTGKNTMPQMEGKISIYLSQWKAMVCLRCRFDFIPHRLPGFFSGTLEIDEFNIGG